MHRSTKSGHSNRSGTSSVKELSPSHRAPSKSSLKQRDYVQVCFHKGNANDELGFIIGGGKELGTGKRNLGIETIIYHFHNSLKPGYET